MIIRYKKIKNKKNIDNQFITNAILNFTKKSKFPRQLLLNKINILVEKNKKTETEILVNLRKFQEKIEELRKNKINLNNKNKRLLEKLRSEIIN